MKLLTYIIRAWCCRAIVKPILCIEETLKNSLKFDLYSLLYNGMILNKNEKNDINNKYIR